MKKTKIIALFLMVFAGSVFSAIATSTPLSFSVKPTYPQYVTNSGSVTVGYTLSNNIAQSLPLTFTATVNNGTIAASGGTCGSNLAGHQTCTKTFLYTAPSSSGTATGSINVDYNGQYPLTDTTLTFVANSYKTTATLTISPSPAGVAVNGISTDVNHAGTQQFSALEISSNGTVNTSPTVTWVSSNTAAATINASTGLATGIAVGTTTITATDTSDSTVTASSTLTVHAIGDVISSAGNGYVYCMGIGTDITNCPYLPAGNIGGVIYPTDSSAAIQWYNGTNTNIGANSPSNGAANTTTIIASQGTGSYAANTCNTIASTWYLPAINELETISKNSLAINSVHTGTLNVTNDYYYWSSTEYSKMQIDIDLSNNFYSFAWATTLIDGTNNAGFKNAGLGVRCVRRF